MPDWYVNCDEDQDEHRGPEIQVNVGVLFDRWWLDCCSSGQAAITWEVVADDGNVDYDEYGSTQRVRFNPTTTLEDIEAAFSRKLALSQVGGDSFTVHVYKGTDDDPALTIADIVTRRSLPPVLSIETASDATEATYQRIKGRILTGFADAFIDLEEVEATASDNPGPRHQVVAVAHQCQGEQGGHRRRPHRLRRFPRGSCRAAGGSVPGRVLQSHAWAFAEGPMDLDDPARRPRVLARGRRQWQSARRHRQRRPPSRRGTSPGRRTTTGSGAARESPTSSPTRPSPQDPPASGSPIRFVTKIGGTSFTAQKCVVVTQDMPFPFLPTIKATSTAPRWWSSSTSWGIALGLAKSMREKHRSGDWRERNDRWYTNAQGGQGTHCSYNALLRANGHADALHYQVFSTGTHVWTPQRPAQPLCIMYHSRTSVTHEIPGFCDRCIAILRRRNLTLAGDASYTKTAPVVLF